MKTKPFWKKNNFAILIIILIIFQFTVIASANPPTSCGLLLGMTADLEREGFVANTPDMQKALAKIAKYAEHDVTVLISGETGSGKEILARLVHIYNPRRRGKPFVVIDSTMLKGDTAVSRLFGHEMGAFTGAVRKTNGLIGTAIGGTIFIDEVADLNPEAQAMLLRFLNVPAKDRVIHSLGAEKPTPANVRVVIATNVDLAKLVAKGDFREDLYHRINVARIDLRPLRERPDEILPMARSFLQKFSAIYGRQFSSFSPASEAALRTYSWPGNIRQLSHVLERSVLDGPENSRVMEKQDLLLDKANVSSSTRENMSILDFAAGDGDQLLERIEATAIRDSYLRGDKVQKNAAEILGVTPRVFNYKWFNIRQKYPELFPESIFGPLPINEEQELATPAALKKAS